MSATGPPTIPVDVTDHHHPLHQNHHESLDNEVAAATPAIISTTPEVVEMKSALPMRIDNSTTTATAASSNSDINQNQKTNWVKFDDDDSSNNNTNLNSTTTNIGNGDSGIGSSAATTITTKALVNNGNNKSNNITPQHQVTTSTIATVNVTTRPTTAATIKTADIPVIPGPPAQANNRISSQKAIQEITPAPAVLSHVNLNSVTTSPQNATTTKISTINKNAATTASANSGGAPMRTIELSTGRIREGFANGDVIVTLLPTNTRWPWVTPAIFRPELVPEELMAQGLTLTVEEYVNAMETLVNDYRFTVYNICYKRVLVCWILFAFCVLLTLLVSGLKGIALFSLGVGWLFLNAAAIFFCMWIKLRLSRGLEKCLARVNKLLIRHKIMLVLDDRGRISCHKVNLCFLYFDPAQCVAYLNEFIERSEQNGANIQAGWEAKLDVDINDIVIQGSNPVRLSRKQERALLLYLRYGSRWGNDALRGLCDTSITEPARHCAKFICPCQYIERHLSCKPRVMGRYVESLHKYRVRSLTDLSTLS